MRKLPATTKTALCATLIITVVSIYITVTMLLFGVLMWPWMRFLGATVAAMLNMMFLITMSVVASAVIIGVDAAGERTRRVRRRTTRPTVAGLSPELFSATNDGPSILPRTSDSASTTRLRPFDSAA